MNMLKIPQDDVKALEILANMTSAEFDTLLDALANMEPAVSYSGLARQLLPHGFPKETARRVARFATTLHSVRSRLEIPVDEMLAAIQQSLAQHNQPMAEPVPWKLLSLRIEQLLSRRPVAITARATDVATDCHRLYCTARIVTQLTPVYIEEPPKPPAAMLMTHVLRITYHERQSTRDFHVVLDREDIEQLQRTLDRARLKEKSLRDSVPHSLLADTGDH